MNPMNKTPADRDRETASMILADCYTWAGIIGIATYFCVKFLLE